MRLEIRLHAYQVGTNTRFGTEVIFYPHLIGPDWLMRSELGYLGYFFTSLISGFNGDAATLKTNSRDRWVCCTETTLQKLGC